jgi:methionine-rich copper-binding protein CopC
MRRALLTLTAAFVLAAGQAQAHAMLEHALPRVGAVVRAAPRELRLWFSERIEPALSNMTLATAAGRPVPIGHLALVPGDGRQVTAAIPAALSPGAYRVRWRVVSVDSHRTQGDFTFEVKP